MSDLGVTLENLLIVDLSIYVKVLHVIIISTAAMVIILERYIGD